MTSVPFESPGLAPLTSVSEDYLKVVYSAHEWSAEPVTTSWLAERLGVVASTVSENVRRLAGRGLLVHERYGDVRLTAAGREHAVRVVRRHRIIETFLTVELGYRWDEVHAEAEVLEHAVSEQLIDRMHERLGRPGRDPHGDPIPAADGSIVMPPATRLSELVPGVPAAVVRVSDADPQLLRELASLGLVLDVVVVVTGRSDRTGKLQVAWSEVAGGPETSGELGESAAAALWVVPA